MYMWNGKTYNEMPKDYVEEIYSFLKEYKFKNSTWYQYLDKNFAQKVKQNIVYNSPVAHINYSGNQVILTTKEGKTYTADKVIVTVSLGVLQSKGIQFTPALPKKKIAAIESVYFPKGFKLFMKFSEKFYPDMISCETPEGEKSYYDVAYHKDAKDNVLALLCVGPTAEAYNKLDSDEKIVEAVLKELDKIFDGKASKTYLGEYVLQNWTKKPYILGTYTESFEHSKETLKWLDASVDNKVYFAGETYDTDYRSTVHGAIISGNKKAIELLNSN